ncbi:hypothetical protein OKA04_06975 [Luteolibacter flavescens]|uniref:Uncharacterized protein n=1 Tax=Luteolibacter flavescens TaxID=1859460 RepID=A0ABT3FLL2_9BACT|nr:hypothetical protein [Luteolibacter flavescens]MCW1884468.1 hypothetical protein [Luteolibacter flavescens]
MRPLPTTTQAAPLPTKPAGSPAVSQTLDVGPLHQSSPPAQNRRSLGSPAVQRAYPWLLVTSTALAAIFCGLYLTKPVVVAAAGPGPGTLTNAPAPPMPAMVAGSPKQADSLLPHGSLLPGDTAKPQAADPKRLASAGSGPETAFEETNLRIQHVLQAQGPEGEDLGKLTLEVPVLYRSRALRWTPEEVAQARKLMTRIGNYQEAAQMVRNEGQKLLGEWNALIGESIPTPVLRADSPSLSGSLNSSAAEKLDSTQAIEIKNR